MVVLVTGAMGQLGQSLQKVAGKHGGIDFHFASSAETDITNKQNLHDTFAKLKPDFCINASAYTAVDKAETETEQAYLINVAGAKNVAEACQEFGTELIHISTDFVFDGKKKTPYTETDLTNPQGVYALTKLQGEQAIEAVLKQHYIIRTSWLYSEFGNNFMKTMLRLGSERDVLSVVDDQIGTPTYAPHLAEAIIQIILSGQKQYGVYHFSNEGTASWYDFAKEIFDLSGVKIDLKPIPTTAYPTPAKRPEYSVLDKSKIKATFNIEISDWKTALRAI